MRTAPQGGAVAWHVGDVGWRAFVLCPTSRVLVGVSPARDATAAVPAGAPLKATPNPAYKVADTPTFAMPIIDGKRIYVKDTDSLTLWLLE